MQIRQQRERKLQLLSLREVINLLRVLAPQIFIYIHLHLSHRPFRQLQRSNTFPILNRWKRTLLKQEFHNQDVPVLRCNVQRSVL